MKIAGGLKEQGLVVGNTYDKYGSRNPITRSIMRRFHAALDDLVARAEPKTIHEVGCGEGYWVTRWRHAGFDARGSDSSRMVIEIAQANALDDGIDPGHFSVRSVYDIEKDRDSADLIVCCEVLEHVEDPTAALRALQRAAQGYVILSVPREPLWRILNMARGRYLRELGNTHGHIQHWSRRQFLTLVKEFFEVVEVRTPLPWTMLLCRQPGLTL